MQQEQKLKYLKIALIVVGVIFIAGIYDVGVAFGLGLNATATRVRADDYRCLRYFGSFSDSGCERSFSSCESYMVHNLVEYCSWWNNVGPSDRR